MLLACPTCHRPVTFDDATLRAPVGRVAVATCPECHHKAPSTAFQREHERQQKAIDKEKVKRRRDGEKAAYTIARERMRDTEKTRQYEADKREGEARLAADLKHASEVRAAKLVIPCRVCNAGTLVKKNVPRFGRPGDIAGPIIFGLGLLTVAIWVTVAFMATDWIAPLGVGTWLWTCWGVGTGLWTCTVGSLIGLRKIILQCDKCGAVIPAS